MKVRAMTLRTPNVATRIWRMEGLCHNRNAASALADIGVDKRGRAREHVETRVERRGMQCEPDR